MTTYNGGDLAAKVRAIVPKGVQSVLELVGTSTLKDSLGCAAQGGRVCMTGMLSEQWSIFHFAPMDYIPAGVYLTVNDSGQIRFDKANFQKFIKEVEAGKIKLNISRTFTLDEIGDAHKFMENNTDAGKIVLIPR